MFHSSNPYTSIEPPQQVAEQLSLNIERQKC